jgi:hypothetical protein
LLIKDSPSTDEYADTKTVLNAIKTHSQVHYFICKLGMSGFMSNLNITAKEYEIVYPDTASFSKQIVAQIKLKVDGKEKVI